LASIFSGGGKSATGNTILSRPAFESLLAAKTTTVECQRAQGTWKGKTISVLDMPALFDTEKTETSLEKQLESCRQMCRTGLHAFILVTQVGRFTAEDVAAAKQVWKLFRDKSASRTIILFTCKEDLGVDDLETYVGEAKNKYLCKLMEKCNRRLCGFNNKAEGGEREEQVDKLMRMVVEITKENQGEPYVIPEGPDKSNQHLSIFISIYLYQSLSPSIYLSMSVYISIHPSIHPSTYLFISKSLSSLSISVYLGGEREEQVDKLMRMVEEITKENQGEPYVILEGPKK
uniref:AIG1-type G domain-containing protein n=1 Tax=Pseudonaja textilis TaxID=8673 RepID=A0A670ZCF8_PSETE